MKSIIIKTVLALVMITGFASTSFAGMPETRADGVTVLHVDEYNGYFQFKETVAGLKAGTYEFIVTNRANKMVGFQIQGMDDKTNLDMFPLKPGETRTARVKIGSDGVRFRCPINPTAWIDLDVIN